MALSDLSSAQLHELLRLLREKESLQTKLVKVERTLSALGNESPTPKNQRRSLKKKTHRKGTTLKDAVLKVLEEVGPKGYSVKELAAKAAVNPGSLSVWLYTRGKKVPSLKKVAPGRYSYRPS